MRTNFNSSHNKRITNIGYQTKSMVMKAMGDCLKSEREKKKLKVEDLAKQALTLRAEGKTGEANILGGKASKKANEVSGLVRFKNIQNTY